MYEGSSRSGVIRVYRIQTTTSKNRRVEDFCNLNPEEKSLRIKRETRKTIKRHLPRVSNSVSNLIKVPRKVKTKKKEGTFLITSLCWEISFKGMDCPYPSVALEVR